MNRPILKALLQNDEGTVLKPYLDCCGKPWRECACQRKGLLTIGTGRCIELVGISYPEADAMLDHDIDAVVASCQQSFPWFAGLCDARQHVVLSMVFNLGLEKFKGFQRMIAALEAGNFEQAASEMQNSFWASQVKQRAVRLGEMMRTGGDQTIIH